MEHEFSFATTPEDLAIQASIILGILWLGLHILGYIGTMMWDWVDDHSLTHQNKFGELIFGLVRKDWYRGDDRSDISHFYSPKVQRQDAGYHMSSSLYYDCFESGILTIFGVGIPLICIPFISLFAFLFPWVCASIASFVLIMLLARLSRRTQKVVKKHIEDRDSHIT